MDFVFLKGLRLFSMFWLSNRNDLLMAIDKVTAGFSNVAYSSDSLANKRQTLIFDTETEAGLDWHQTSSSLPLGQGSREP